MEIFGDLERLLSEDLYPYRVPLTLAAVAALVLGVTGAWRTGWIARGIASVRRRPAPSALVGLATLALVIPLANYLVAPLWTRTEVVEASPLDVDAYQREQEGRPQPAREVIASPVGPQSGAPSVSPTPSASQPRVVSQGEWRGADEFHFARGRALIVESASGQFVLRVEAFSVRNGPDLYVMLSPAADGYREGALKLGRLKATDGAFNYEIPAGTNLDAFKSVVIWCEQFATLFGTAPLSQNP